MAPESLVAEGAAEPESISARWRLVDVEYTAIFSDGLDPDPSVVAAIRIFDPAYVPLLVRRVHQAPTGGVVAYGYHVIGRQIEPGQRTEDAAPVKLGATPSDWPFSRERVYAQRTWSLPWKKGSWQFRNGFPEIYLPHDMWLCRWMRARHYEMFGEAADIKAQLVKRWREETEAEQRELDHAQALAKNKLRDDRHEVSDAVANELFWMEHPRQQPDPTPEPKPFSDLGRKAS